MTGGQTFSAAENTMLTVQEIDGRDLKEYLTEVERVVNMTFPDQSRRKRIDDNTWKVQMLQQDLVGVRFQPKTTLKVFYDEETGLNIDVTDLELGLPPEFIVFPPNIEVKGTLRPAAKLPRNKIILRGQVSMALTAALPPQLMLIPGVQGVCEAILGRILKQLRSSLEDNIATDYAAWVADRE
eukprot:CAMPEP_0167740970 /NCGR_PEP_ID=MMETSP0110_2-20121227/593_1 /TAXON_ID=629695 /ORGANISM="Gymnochlora sp., Strain CCMP2014" /LENGTH=182 /DNA_ID=CAMNT_0007624963 /DNA_START=226 /DNA_END=774 /DNA_ORIENTATION=+